MLTFCRKCHGNDIKCNVCDGTGEEYIYIPDVSPKPFKYFDNFDNEEIKPNIIIDITPFRKYIKKK